MPGPLPGLNDLIAAAKGAGGSGRAYAKLKRDWTQTIAWLAKAARLKSAGSPVDFEFTWHERDRRRDKDNVAAGGRKLVLDGLVTAGVLGGDGWAHVGEWTDRFVVDEGAPGVRVVLQVPIRSRETLHT